MMKGVRGAGAGVLVSGSGVGAFVEGFCGVRLWFCFYIPVVLCSGGVLLLLYAAGDHPPSPK